MLADDDWRAECRIAIAAIVFEFDFATQIEVFDGADVSIQADEKRLHAALVVLKVRLEFYALNKFRRRVRDVQIHVGNRHAIGVALPRRSGPAGLRARDDINPDHENCHEQSNPKKKKQPCTFPIA